MTKEPEVYKLKQKKSKRSQAIPVSWLGRMNYLGILRTGAAICQIASQTLLLPTLQLNAHSLVTEISGPITKKKTAFNSENYLLQHNVNISKAVECACVTDHRVWIFKDFVTNFGRAPL